jgi:hypothetical protein
MQVTVAHHHREYLGVAQRPFHSGQTSVASHVPSKRCTSPAGCAASLVASVKAAATANDNCGSAIVTLPETLTNRRTPPRAVSYCPSETLVEAQRWAGSTRFCLLPPAPLGRCRDHDVGVFGRCVRERDGRRGVGGQALVAIIINPGLRCGPPAGHHRSLPPGANWVPYLYYVH